MFEDLFNDIDFNDILSGLDNYFEIYNNTLPKRYWRKNRFKGKTKKTYIICYNHLHDLLPSPRMINMMLRCIGKGGRI